MLNPTAFQQTLHMTLAAYAATGFAVAGIHAFLLLFDPAERLPPPRAHACALLVGARRRCCSRSPGTSARRSVAAYQPAKLAAMEAHFETRRRAPLTIGGWPDVDGARSATPSRFPTGSRCWPSTIPTPWSRGLNEFPREDWPNVPIVHLAFQIMVALGTYLALVSLWVGWLAIRRRDLLRSQRLLLRAIALAAPMGFIAIEAGWTVTEVGRQPWIIHGVLRTADAVTPMPGLIVAFLLFTLLYCFLGVDRRLAALPPDHPEPEIHRVDPGLQSRPGPHA